MKKCSICKKEKEFKDFNKFVRSKDGYRPDCRECQKISSKEYSSKYYKNNKEILLKKGLKYKEENREVLREKSLEYYYNTKVERSEKIRESNKKNREGKDFSEYRKEYYLNNKEEISERKKKYRKDNKNKINEYQRFYINQRLKNDILFKISHYYRNMIRKSFNRGGFNKKSKTFEILGCSFEEFKLYLENKFEDWMDWNNRGLYNGELNYGWDIDHIIPISSAETEEDVIRLNHYTNLQPLCSYINRDIKRDSI